MALCSSGPQPRSLPNGGRSRQAQTNSTSGPVFGCGADAGILTLRMDQVLGGTSALSQVGAGPGVVEGSQAVIKRSTPAQAAHPATTRRPCGVPQAAVTDHSSDCVPTRQPRRCSLQCRAEVLART